MTPQQPLVQDARIQLVETIYNASSQRQGFLVRRKGSIRDRDDSKAGSMPRTYSVCRILNACGPGRVRTKALDRAEIYIRRRLPSRHFIGRYHYAKAAVPTG